MDIKELEGCLKDETKEQMDQLRDKMDKIMDSILDYKNDDTVYFLKFYANKPSKIVKQKYRSAKKYTDLLFPTHDLAAEYHNVFYKMFSVLCMVAEDIVPKLAQERIDGFEEMRLDDYKGFEVKEV